VHKRRLIVGLKGGMGNQMFQYAAGRALSLRNNMEIILDTTSGFVRDRVYRRSFGLGILDIKVRRASVLEQLPFWFENCRQKISSSRLMPITRRPWGDYLCETDPMFFNEISSVRLDTKIWMQGFWQSEKYFFDYRDIIATELAPPVPKTSNFLSIAQAIRSCNSVAVGVRIFEDIPSTDKSGVGGLTPSSFYEDAARQIVDYVKKPTFFVFCTSMAAVKDKLMLPGTIHYLTSDNGFSDQSSTLWLISQCKHHIISNSSFYWWSAWLAERRYLDTIVIGSDLFPNRDTIPERWGVIKTIFSNKSDHS
jgi:hypothetical protein